MERDAIKMTQTLTSLITGEDEAIEPVESIPAALTAKSIAAPVSEDTTTTDGQMQQAITDKEDQDTIDFAMSSMAEEQEPAESIESPIDPESKSIDKPEEDTKDDVAISADIGRGIIESPIQIVGGAIDSFNESMKTLNESTSGIVDAATIKAEDLEGMVSPEILENFERLESVDIEHELAKLPTTREAASTTGGYIRSIAQFATGFGVTGKIQKLQKLREMGLAGRISSDAFRGALVDFVAFDPFEGNFAEFIESVPGLSNVVTQALTVDEDDTALIARSKAALSGLVPGVLLDYAATMLAKGLRKTKLFFEAKEELVNKVPELKQMKERAAAQREIVKELLGDPDAPLMRDAQEEITEKALLRGDDAPIAPAKGESDVFINWSRIDSTDDVKAIIQDAADAFSEDISKAQRGVVGWKQTKLDAEQLDAFEILANRRDGEPLGNAETYAVRELWARSGKKLAELTDAVNADPSDINKIAFRKMLAVHNSIQEQVLAARTETARALNAWRIPAGDDVSFSGQMDQLKSFMDTDQTTEQIAERLGQLKAAGLTKEADAFVYGTPWAKTADAVAQLWYFSLLSGPKTHMRNMIGNTATILFEMTERKGASIIGQALGEQNVPTGEATAQFFGMLQGFKDAFRISAKGGKALFTYGDSLAKTVTDMPDEFGTFHRAVATGESGIGVGKVEQPRIGAFDPEKLGLGADNPLSYVMRFIDSTTRAPGTALNAADEVFKTLNYRMELNAQAFRKATKEFNSGQIDNVGDRVTELLNDPEEFMRMESQRRAEINTFTNRPENTQLWKTFKAIGEVPILGKLILPFRRTPYDIGTYTFSRTPLAPLVKLWRDDIAAGGAKADIAWSKFLTGNAVLLMMGDLALNGDITGEGSPNRGRRETEQRMGKKRSSVRVQTGENKDGTPQYRYFSYQSLEPLSTSLGIAANVVEILKGEDWEDQNAETDEMVIAATMAIANQVTSAQYMSGVSQFFTAMSDPTRYGESWWKRLAGATIPTGVAEITRAQDPYLREVNNMTAAILARTPGFSKDLPNKRDAWGRKRSRESGLGSFYDSASPVYSSSKKAEPIDRELERLELWISKPNKRTSFKSSDITSKDSVIIDLDKFPKAYDRFTELQGQEITTAKYGAPITATGFISSGEVLIKELNMLAKGKHPTYPDDLYKMLTDGPTGGKASLIRSIINAYRDAAKDQLLEEFPELQAEVDNRNAKSQGKYMFGDIK